ncbi:MAG: hypothetical protein QF632_05370 [Candidatus Woesearchaeota archaeon]|nr:hypothetical protein [Candidatus Woesearchaeota archaeon]MDP7324160.1 hypothetical protein [Candidatus Woesearchaeota archaeon]MDP7457390.1 hypothetical protein [Candidatus Woesearchaeota archaeon]
MRKFLPRCPHCTKILMERETFCRGCGNGVHRKDKQDHMLVHHTP